MKQNCQTALLLPDIDPTPVEWVNPESRSPVLLVCEHAGRSIPHSLGDLGLSASALNSHIGWDIGAEAISRRVAHRLKAPLILQRYSRLVIDCNRPPQTQGSIPETIDGQHVPGNSGLTSAEVHARISEIFDPLNRAIEQGFSNAPRRAAFSIHSFTSALVDGKKRPWEAGILARSKTKTAAAMLDCISSTDPNLSLALNEPYKIEDETDWFIPVHAEPREIKHALIEVRNDELMDQAGIERWSALIANAIDAVAGGPE